MLTLRNFKIQFENMKRVIIPNPNAFRNVSECHQDKIYAFRDDGNVYFILNSKHERPMFHVIGMIGYNWHGASEAPTLERLITNLIGDRAEVFEFETHQEFGRWMANL